MNLSEKIIGSILGGCYGDVLGSQTEGITRKDIIEKYVLKVVFYYKIRPNRFKIFKKMWPNYH